MTDLPGPEPAIALENVTVRYAVPREAIDTLKEYALRRLRGRLDHDELVALRKVDLTVRPGESVGVIGPNGAGKSTLFRLLARVRKPTEGRVVVRGRVAALLELGAGFHGELTGRENVILMGTLLGLSRQEMLGRTAAIAAFAEMEPFLDVPLRNYSSGMAARLGFAVATDVEPDVLLVDEALAVGDERFRERCRERMARFRDGRRTFLLVSHALEEVVASCPRTVWISGGSVVADGPSAEVVERYRAWCRDAGTGVS